jgi:hypothetical protein
MNQLEASPEGAKTVPLTQAQHPSLATTRQRNQWAKTDVRYWRERVFKSVSVRAGMRAIP